MSSSIRARALLALAVVAAALMPAASNASMVGAFNCYANGRFYGTVGQIVGVNVWNWSFSASGVCIHAGKVFDFTIVIATPHHSGGFPGPVTFSPHQPWPVWKVQSSLVNGSTDRRFTQLWAGAGGRGSFTIHEYDPTVPHPEFAVGGTTGLGITEHGRNSGTWASPVIKARFVFTFGTKPLPLPELAT